MKKTQVLFLISFIILFIFSGFSFCSAAWKLNVDYLPNIPLAPHLDANSKLPAFILYFYAAGIYLVGALAVLSLVIAGIQLIMSAENPSRISAAKERMKSSAIGLVIVLGAALLGQTIHTQYTNLGLTLNIKEPTGLWLTGSAGKTGAPRQVSDFTRDFGGKYSTISWPMWIQDINGKNYWNCDKNIQDYLIYWYKNTDYSNVIAYTRLSCGASISVRGASYIASPEVPGLYFFLDKNKKNSACAPVYGSDDTPPPVYNLSQPEFTKAGFWRWGNVKCIRIINGPDPLSGPFFGVLFFDEAYYKGNQYMHVSPPKDISISNDYGAASWSAFDAGSFIIYEKAGYEGDRKTLINSGDGVELCTVKSNVMQGCKGGSYKFLGSDFVKFGGALGGQLSNTPAAYPTGSNVPGDEQKRCGKFVDNSTKAYCLGSIRIDGKFLVLVSKEKDGTGAGNLSDSSALFLSKEPGQAFPTVNEDGQSEIDGPSDIGTTFIGKDDPSKMQWVKVIPLAKPF